MTHEKAHGRDQRFRKDHAPLKTAGEGMISKSRKLQISPEVGQGDVLNVRLDENVNF